jgi:hypothetical protein
MKAMKAKLRFLNYLSFTGNSMIMNLSLSTFEFMASNFFSASGHREGKIIIHCYLNFTIFYVNCVEYSYLNIGS